MLYKINLSSQIENEKKNLREYKPPFEVGEYRKVSCNKYGFIRVNNKYFSIPEEYIAKEVSVKIYVDAIKIYHSNENVCTLVPIYNDDEYKVDISHYCKSLSKKPGAVKRLHALRTDEELEEIFNTYYYDDPKRFITLIMDNKYFEREELLKILKSSHKNNSTLPNECDKIQTNIEDSFTLLNKELLGVDNVGA